MLKQLTLALFSLVVAAALIAPPKATAQVHLGVRIGAPIVVVQPDVYEYGYHDGYYYDHGYRYQSDYRGYRVYDRGYGGHRDWDRDRDHRDGDHHDHFEHRGGDRGHRR